MLTKNQDERKHAVGKEDVYGTVQPRSSNARPPNLVNLVELEHLEFQQSLHTTGACTRVE
jgi:hypothetical protein